MIYSGSINSGFCLFLEILNLKVTLRDSQSKDGNVKFTRVSLIAKLIWARDLKVSARVLIP